MRRSRKEEVTVFLGESMSSVKQLKNILSAKRPLSKSRFKLACECPTKLFYTGKFKEYANQAAEDSFLKNLARGGFQVGALAKLSFPGGTEVTTLDYEAALKETNELLRKDKVIIYEAAFNYENLFIRADIVCKDGDALYLYEVKAKSFNPDEDDFWQKRDDTKLNNLWKEYLYDVAFQHYVISKSQPHLTVFPHLTLADKTKEASVEGLNQRFKLVTKNKRDSVEVDPHLKAEDLDRNLLISVPVNREVIAIQSGKANGPEAPDWPKGYTFESYVSFLSEQYLNDKKIAPEIKSECKSCEFKSEVKDNPPLKDGFLECWSQALKLSPDQIEKRKPVFEIWRLGAPAFLEQKVYFMDELQESDFEPKTKPKKEPKLGLKTAERKALQLRETLSPNPKAYFDKENFLKESADYSFPLHFIDFETSMVAIPFNKGRRPYEQIAFQFSHHMLHKDGTIEHKSQWICAEPGKFPNFEFVRALKKELEGDDGTIFRYANHENAVLGQIRNQLKRVSETEVPDKESLIQFIETIARPSKEEEDKWEPKREMVDMLDLVLRFFWHPKMKGSNSIKVALPAILEASSYLKEKYSKANYGKEAEIKSLNVEGKMAWVFLDEKGTPIDPYKRLPKVFGEMTFETLDRLYGDEELRDGGAAMMAYSKMQFTEMSKEERTAICNALLRYCELDTLAMVMLWEGWREWNK